MGCLCKMRTRKTQIGLMATLFTLTAFALSSNAIPPLVTTIAEEFNVSFATFGGFVFFLQFFVFMLASLVGGWAVERFGWSNRSLAVTGVLTLGVFLMAGAVFPDFKWFLALAVPLGFSGGLVETFSSIFLCRFSGSGSSKMMNLSQVFFCFGALFSPFLVSQILRLGIPWRLAFVILGSIALIIGIAFTVLTRTLTEPPIEPMNNPGPAKGSISNEKTAVWSDKLLFMMSAALFLYVVIEG